MFCSVRFHVNSVQINIRFLSFFKYYILQGYVKKILKIGNWYINLHYKWSKLWLIAEKKVEIEGKRGGGALMGGFNGILMDDFEGYRVNI